MQLEKTTSRVNQYYGIGAVIALGVIGGRVNQYYGIGAVIALGVIGGLGYYIYWSKKGGWGEEQPSSNLQQINPLKTNKFEMD